MGTKNAPCSCGSGKRYKHCCGRFPRDSVAPRRAQLVAASTVRALARANLFREAIAIRPPEIAERKPRWRWEGWGKWDVWLSGRETAHQ